MIKIIIYTTILLITLNAGAVSDKGFVLNVLQGNVPVREIAEDGKRRAAIPFDTEYKLRLKNANARRCTARVKIDGALVSKLGDIIVDSNGHLDLERFLDASLSEGKRFKFVTLEHPDVDDPKRVENGLIEVEFRLEKERVYIQQPNYFIPPNQYYFTNSWGFGDIIFTTTDCSATINCSATMPGATVGGSQSQQSFHKATMDTEEKVVTLKLWLRGIK